MTEQFSLQLTAEDKAKLRAAEAPIEEPLSQAQYDAEVKPSIVNEVKPGELVGGTQTESDFRKQIIEQYRPGFDVISIALNQGNRGVANTMVWREAWIGNISKEEAANRTQPTQAMLDDQNKLDEFEKIFDLPSIPVRLAKTAMEGGTPQSALLGWGLEGGYERMLNMPLLAAEKAAQTAPYIVEIVKWGAAGAASLGAIGAAGGLVAGPAGAAAGGISFAARGFTGGAYIAATQLMAADAYRELVENGVPEEAAHNYAMGYGLIAGAIENVQLTGIGRMTKKAFIDTLKKDVKKGLSAVAAEIMEEIGTQIVEEELQEVAAIITRIIADTQFDLPRLSKEEILKRLTETLIEAAVAAPALVAGGHFTGKFTGKVAKGMTKGGKDLVKATVEIAKVIKEESKDKPTSLNQLLGRVEKSAEQKQAEEEKRLSKLANMLFAAIEYNESVKQPEEDEYYDEAEERLKKAESRLDKAKEDEKQIKEEIEALKQQNDLTVGEKNIREELHKQALKKARIQQRRAYEAIRKAKFAVTVKKVAAIMETAISQFVIESDETDKQEFSRNQNILVDLIKYSDLPETERGIFLRAVAKAQSTTNLISIAKEVNEDIRNEIEADEKAKAKKLLKKVAEKGEPIGKGKQKRSRFDPESYLQEIIDWYAHFIGKSAKENQERIADPLTAWVEKGDSQLDFDTVAEIANQVGDLSQKSSREVLDLAQKVNDAIDIGIEGKLAKDFEWKQKLDNLIDKVISAILGRDTQQQDYITGTEAGEQRWLDTFGQAIFSWEGKLEIIFQRTKEITDLLSTFSVHNIIQTIQTNKRQQGLMLVDELTKATGLSQREVIKELIKGAQTKHRTKITFPSNFTDKETGAPLSVTIEMTRNELIKLWNQMNDPTLKSGLREGNGYTFPEDNQGGDNLYDLLDQEILTDREKQLAAGLRSFYDKYFPRLAEEYRAETGLDLEQLANYSGFAKRRGKGKNEIVEKTFHDQMRMLSGVVRAGKPGSTIERTDSKLPLLRDDAFADVFRHIDQVERYKAWREASKLFAGVFNNDDVEETIRKQYGDDMYKAIHMHLNDMIHGAGLRFDLNVRAITKMLGNAGIAFLGLKFHAYAKQWMSYLNFALVIPVNELNKGIADYWRNKKTADRIIESMPLWQNRYADFETNVQGLINEQDLRALEKGKMADVWLFFLKLGDRHVSKAGAWAVYRYTKETLGKTHEEAVHAAERAINTTQSSGTMDQVSNIARHPIGKVAMMFAQQPTRMFEYQVNAWRKYFNHRTDENLYQAVRAVVITHAAQALFLTIDAAVITALSGDDDEKESAWWKVFNSLIAGPMAPLPDWAVGTFLTKIEKRAGAEAESYEFSMIPVQAVNRAGKLLEHTLSTMEDGDVDMDEVVTLLKDWARSGNLVTPVVGGLPIDPPVWLFKTAMENSNIPGDLGEIYRSDKQSRERAKRRKGSGSSDFGGFDLDFGGSDFGGF